jgi:ribosome-associated toxin RatA of RatAB toxin-antitoxin module
MASIHKEIAIQASAEKVWAVVRDIGAVHKRFVPGLVTDVRLEAGARIVTFANGMVVRELIVAVDDERRRLAYAAVGGMFKHHNASMQVIAEGQDRCRLLWITDLLPDEAAKDVGNLIDEGAVIMKRTLERENAA